MIKIKELTTVDKEAADSIANIHMEAFPNFFLTSLGKSFVRTLYISYLEDEESGIIIATEKQGILGFIAYSKDYSGFYKRIIKRHLIRFATNSIAAIVKHPSIIGRILGAFRKSEDVRKKEKYVEVASICVSPKVHSKGIGTELLNYIKKQTDFNRYEYINLETDATNNDRVNSFYRKNGFYLERSYITSEGRKMNEYRYRGHNK